MLAYLLKETIKMKKLVMFLALVAFIGGCGFPSTEEIEKRRNLRKEESSKLAQFKLDHALSCPSINVPAFQTMGVSNQVLSVEKKIDSLNEKLDRVLKILEEGKQ